MTNSEGQDLIVGCREAAHKRFIQERLTERAENAEPTSPEASLFACTPALLRLLYAASWPTSRSWVFTDGGAAA